MMKQLIGLILMGSLLIGCMADKDSIGKLLKENPEIMTDAIKANPDKFITALNEAVKDAQKSQRDKAEQAEKKAYEESFSNPMEPQIREDEIIRGNKDAQLTLIEYSDFECPFCSRGYNTVTALLKKYKGNIRFVYKHLPLSFHPNAMPAAQYYEALRLQGDEKAIQFHDMLFDQFSKIKQGEKFFRAIAKKTGANMTKLEKDLESAEVKKRIDEDLAEAKKFGFQGTPGFLINGIPVKGAYPPDHFDGIIEELKKRGKVNI